MALFRYYFDYTLVVNLIVNIRLTGVPKNKQVQDGIDICVEAIQSLKEVEGVAGFHVMAIGWEEEVSEIVARSGPYSRPEV